jgi:hypothetical protein
MLVLCWQLHDSTLKQKHVGKFLFNGVPNVRVGRLHTTESRCGLYSYKQVHPS